MTKKTKVLMVDDEAQFRETTRKILEKKGFETLMAANGREALAQLDKHPDVVVLDIRMPDMDGNETLEEIQKRSPGLPVIMLTGHGADQSAKKALVHGAFDYLSKPCDIDLLASRIMDASAHKDTASDRDEERKVEDVMIPLAEYTQLNENRTVAEGVAELKKIIHPPNAYQPDHGNRAPQPAGFRYGRQSEGHPIHHGPSGGHHARLSLRRQALHGGQPAILPHVLDGHVHPRGPPAGIHTRG